MSEREITEEDVRAEHLEEVDERTHWAYLIAVFAVGTALMLALIGLLGAQG
jgi:hypothetical protein